MKLVHKKKATIPAVLFLAIGLLSCAEDDKDKGKGGDGQPCLPNGKCHSGLQCVKGSCVPLSDGGADGTVPDQTVPDQSQADHTMAEAGDLSLKDAPTPDVAHADATVADGAPDSAAPLDLSPDMAVPDGPQVDLAKSDVGTPDKGTPDSASPDVGGPDAAVADAAADQGVQPPVAPTMKWGYSAGGTLAEEGAGIAVDGSGNVYVTGKFSDTVSFMGSTIKSQAGFDGFVASISPAGKLNWVKTLSGPGAVLPLDIAVDSAGNSFVVGKFTQSIKAGTKTLTALKSYDGFVLKMDAKGDALWAEGAKGAGSGEVTSVALDSAGDAHIAGKGTAVLGGTTVNGPIYVAKVSSTASWKWSTRVGGETNTVVGSVALDSVGNSYVVGGFRSTGTFGSKTSISKGMQDIFVAKVTSSGSLGWVTTAGGIGEDHGYAVAVDASGKIQITGSFGYANASAAFGSFTLKPVGSIHSNFYLASLDSSGKFLSAVGGGTAKVTVGDCMAANGSKGVIVSGRFGGSGTFGKHPVSCNSLVYDIFLVQADSSGAYQWAANAGGTTGKAYKTFARDIAISKTGAIYLIGDFWGTATFGGKSFTSSGNRDVMILKFD